MVASMRATGLMGKLVGKVVFGMQMGISMRANG